MKDKWGHLKNKFDPTIIGLLIAVSFIFGLISWITPPDLYRAHGVFLPS